ncbi:MAG: hypothetical protein JWO06_1461 [Bacteroidota bacterium]|nr:hypothetical protein [Bacteroidota bacterium]
MHLNILLSVAIAALVPLLIGFVWYNPMVFGKAWMNSVGMTQDSMKGGNMVLVFILTYIFSFFLAFALNSIVIHQFGLLSLLQAQAGHTPDPAMHNDLLAMLSKYQGNFRSYKHGALHGTIAGITIALPIIGVNALFERRGFKYIAINVGFWTVCLAIMGAFLCHFVDTSFMLK